MRVRNLSIICFLFVVNIAFFFAQSGASRLLSARNFEEKGRFDEALEQYEYLIGSDADPEVIYNARLGAGRIYLVQKGDLVKAAENIESVLMQVSLPELAAQGYVLKGLTEIRGAGDEPSFRMALSQFDMVIDTYPNSEALVDALMASGSILEFDRQLEEAKSNYQTVIFKFPDSRAAPQSLRRLAHCLIKQGNSIEALRAYQNIQINYQEDSFAQSAKNEASALYRLYLLNTKQKRLSVKTLISDSKQFKIDDPLRIEFLEEGILLVDKDQPSLLTPEGVFKQRYTGNYQFCLNKKKCYQVSDKVILLPDGSRVSPFYIENGERKQFDKILTIAVNEYDETMISAEDPDGIITIDLKSGQKLKELDRNEKATRMIVDSEKNVYVLLQNQEGLLIYNRWGIRIDQLESRQFGMDKIVDLGLDVFDNLYLLDKEGQFLIVGSRSRIDNFRLKELYRQQLNDEKSKPMKDLRAIGISDDGQILLASKKSILLFN